MSCFSVKISLICMTLTTIICLNGLVESRKEKIKLKDIEVLTLKPNEWTTGRRSKPVPQLQCVGGYCDAIKGQTVQCYNRGSDGVDVQWECKTQISSDYKFGAIDVICEGYDYPDDPYVLVGSCGLEYNVDGVDPKHSTHNTNNDYSHSQYRSKPSNHLSFGFIICVIIIIFIIYYTCLRPNGRTHRDDNPRSTSPPPPPGFRSDFFDGSDGCSSSRDSTGFSGYANQRPNYGTNTGNTGNGFFSGLLAGGSLGYLFGSRNTTNYRDQTSYFGRRADPPSYFSGSGARSSGSTTTTTTSGFGGTKRR